jgi:hypothetical protein
MMWGNATHSLRVLVLLLAALCAPRAAGAAAHPALPSAAPANAAAPPQHRHRHDLAPAAAARAPPSSPAHPDIGPGGVNVTALLLGGDFDLGSITDDNPLVDAICASPLCVKLCRDACHALTMNRLTKIVVKFPEGKTEDEIADSVYAPDAVLLVSPIAVLVGGKVALEYITVRRWEPAAGRAVLHACPVLAWSVREGLQPLHVPGALPAPHCDPFLPPSSTCLRRFRGRRQSLRWSI